MPIVLDDVCLNKSSIMERSLRRVLEEYQIDPSLTQFSHIDAMTLNVERACQAAIDLAMHLVAREHLGIPQNSADAFRLLHKAGSVSESVARSMIAMTGFRNIAIHEYQEMDMSVLHAIGTTYWKDIVLYCHELGMSIRP
jgi:uncharacterized protein YutE (UPF0331/DUF86 family)